VLTEINTIHTKIANSLLLLIDKAHKPIKYGFSSSLLVEIGHGPNLVQAFHFFSFAFFMAGKLFFDGGQNASFLNCGFLWPILSLKFSQVNHRLNK
jgi:hypothetical protein